MVFKIRKVFLSEVEFCFSDVVWLIVLGVMYKIYWYIVRGE